MQNASISSLTQNPPDIFHETPTREIYEAAPLNHATQGIIANNRLKHRQKKMPRVRNCEGEPEQVQNPGNTLCLILCPITDVISIHAH